MSPILPSPLEPGGTIALVAPAGVVDPQRLARGADRLHELGYRTRMYRDVTSTRGYLAGDDAVRADEFNTAFADPDVQAVFVVRGGYGCGRILDRLDYELIRNCPKVLIGFSDVSALHSAIGTRTSLVTFHGPNLVDGIGAAEGLSPLSDESLWAAIAGRQGGRFEIDLSLHASPRCVRPGVAKGRLVGGNLAVVAGLIGTPYEINTKGALLLLEDIGEPPYRLDRFFTQLRLAGKLDEVAGIVLGQFTDCVDESGKASLHVEDLIEDYILPLNVPVLASAPIGHTRQNAVVPLGWPLQLDTATGVLRSEG